MKGHHRAVNIVGVADDGDKYEQPGAVDGDDKAVSTPTVEVDVDANELTRPVVIRIEGATTQLRYRSWTTDDNTAPNDAAPLAVIISDQLVYSFSVVN